MFIMKYYALNLNFCKNKDALIAECTHYVNYAYGISKLHIIYKL